MDLLVLLTRYGSLLLLLICGVGVSAPVVSAPSAEAVRLEVVPELDGKVLGDRWLTPSLSGFWQQRPVEGTRSTQETEVYIGYTDTTLYVGIVAYDDNPSGIIMADSRRDASLENGDNVSFIIDSFMDQQNGLVFGTNLRASNTMRR